MDWLSSEDGLYVFLQLFRLFILIAVVYFFGMGSISFRQGLLSGNRKLVFSGSACLLAALF